MEYKSNKQWTFGILSTEINFSNNILQHENLRRIIKSIVKQNINKEDYEILIIGSNSYNKNIKTDNVKFINFDETIKNKWITKKKNIIFDAAKFENIIVMHDYVIFEDNWYDGYQKFDYNWDVSMCKIYNKDGTRWRDWILWWCGEAPYILEHNNTRLCRNRLLYDDRNYVNTEMYINGTVIIGKRDYLKLNKLDENLVWGQGEDCEWSRRCRTNWNYKMNTNSKLKLLKQHDNT